MIVVLAKRTAYVLYTYFHALYVRIHTGRSAHGVRESRLPCDTFFPGRLLCILWYNFKK